MEELAKVIDEAHRYAKLAEEALEKGDYRRTAKCIWYAREELLEAADELAQDGYDFGKEMYDALGIEPDCP